MGFNIKWLWGESRVTNGSFGGGGYHIRVIKKNWVSRVIRVLGRTGGGCRLVVVLESEVKIE